MISVIFAIAQVIAPVLPDNQWRPTDQAYAWPLPNKEWDVIYYHGDQVTNNIPPRDLVFEWDCHLHEPTKRATCVSSWEVKAGATCRYNRWYEPWEHPTFWYERYRGTSLPNPAHDLEQQSRVFLWSYSQRINPFPDWSKTPRYVWDYQRIQWIPSGPNCSPTAGCSPRARYFVQERSNGLFVFDDPTAGLNTWPIGAPIFGNLGLSRQCRGWMKNTDWCLIDPSRSECSTNVPKLTP